MKQLGFIILLALLSSANCCIAQDKNPTSNNAKIHPSSDTIFYVNDTASKNRPPTAKYDEGFLQKKLNKLIGTQKKIFKNSQYQKSDSNLKPLLSINNLRMFNFKKSFFKINGGFVSYNINYRSYIDTPFAEKNIMQHNACGNINFLLADIPFKMNYLLRRSNSIFFRNINDVQIEFDAMQFSRNIRSGVKNKLTLAVAGLRDTLLELNYKATLEKYKDYNNWFNTPGILQKLIEFREILNLPGITYDSKLSDSINDVRSAKMKDSARLFLNEYNKRAAELDSIKTAADSLQRFCNNMYSKIQAYKKWIDTKLDGYVSLEGLEQSMKGYGVNNIALAKKYQWLLNIQKFGLGRNQLNYSELTSKNMSLTGINFEYNSWYYVAFAAGKIDYRFRDFVTSPNGHRVQNMIMTRVGIGRLEGNHFILSAYKGQKQLFTVTNNTAGSRAINISGFAAEAKFMMNRNTYVLAEAAQSLSPDFRTNPTTTTKFNFNDNSNKAISFKFHSYLPKTLTRVEGVYKYSGANFQSFSSFQTNSSLIQWYIKADQQFLKRKLKIALALRSNEFSNPYIIQNYKSNTVFKSVQATYRTRQFPVLTMGFQPTSQITSIDNRFVENQFYSFNAGITHSYKIGDRRASSILIYNRFYNNKNDTGFLYYNAENIFFNHTILFSLYTMNFTVSHSKSSSFELNVLDAGLQVQFSKIGRIGFGAKVNSFDRVESTIGGYGNIQLNVRKLGIINMVYDNGYIPGSNHRFVKNSMMNLSFTRSF